MLSYASVCSGVAPQTSSWSALGLHPAWFAEIERFPSAVLNYRFPEVPNLGDFTEIDEALGTAFGPIDLLVGGTPCQSFSVAGKRAGLDDPRGNLTLEFARLARRLRPRWLVWENVPGVLSIDGGRTFGAFLEALAEIGYGFAYRILNAQYFGVPQRRRRVFVVGCLGDWRAAAAVLFERHSLSGNPPPRREKGERVTGSLASRAGAGGGLGTDFECSGGVIPTGGSFDEAVSSALVASGRGTARSGESRGQDCVIPEVCGTLSDGAHMGGGLTGRTPIAGESSLANAVTCHYVKGGDPTTDNYVVTGGFPDTAHSLRADGFDASEDGTGRGTPIIPILEAGARTGKSTDDPRAGMGVGEAGDPMFTLQSGKQHAIGFGWNKSAAQTMRVDDTTDALQGSPTSNPAVCIRTAQTSANGHGIAEDVSHTLDGAQGQAVCFESRYARNGRGAPDEIVPPLKAQSGETGKGDAAPLVAHVVNVNSTPETASELAFPLRADDGSGNRQAIQSAMAVRRLTPREAERLQGFSDDFTRIPIRFYKHKRVTKTRPDDYWDKVEGGWMLMAADSPRYKAIGNSWAVPVLEWIGKRIVAVDELLFPLS